MVISQEVSIMVYSCFWKGIETWFSPFRNTHIPHADVENYRAWEAAFERQVYDFLGLNYPAKALFLCLKGIWHFSAGMMRRMGNKQDGTDRIFSGFRAPLPQDFQPETNNLASLRLEVQEETNGITGTIYTVTLEHVPHQIYHHLDQALIPAPYQESFYGPVFFPFILVGFMVPIAVALKENSSRMQSIFIIEQMIVLILKFYDASDVKINTRFEEAGSGAQGAAQENPATPQELQTQSGSSSATESPVGDNGTIDHESRSTTASTHSVVLPITHNLERGDTPPDPKSPNTTQPVANDQMNIRELSESGAPAQGGTADNSASALPQVGRLEALTSPSSHQPVSCAEIHTS
ncbi:hypothetical protein AYL99_08068 [Fonsecaea erecta]|uniref:Uncharacterized protein n=1 Tax=Fonsecaea erecta TaxID=1367422 RepID=A0A178ZC16_9EURO|nr:hypothetical protein AYL99_08068 [Fonsecaea erecta]OAP57330.1 hypothetical protein AYL99_08068 [Fonsecaea erecta]